MTKAEMDHLLYEDEHGEVIGLDEVQLSSDTLSHRQPKLEALLARGPGDYIAFQAAIILTAWGSASGLAFLSDHARRWKRGDEVLSPNRIYGYDDALDTIADAVDVFLGKRPGDADAIDLLRHLLGLYGDADFHSKLAWVLRWEDLPELTADVDAAIDRAFKAGKFYMASQLLPVRARWHPDEPLPHFDDFLRLPDDPSPRINVAEALGYARSPDRQRLLIELAADRDRVVAEEAIAALKRI